MPWMRTTVATTERKRLFNYRSVWRAGYYFVPRASVHAQTVTVRDASTVLCQTGLLPLRAMHRSREYRRSMPVCGTRFRLLR